MWGELLGGLAAGLVLTGCVLGWSLRVLARENDDLREQLNTERARTGDAFDRLAARDHAEYVTMKRWVGEWDPEKDEPGGPSGRVVSDPTGLVQVRVDETEPD
jgi:hypothetical protein